MTHRMTRSFTNWFVLILFISLCAHAQAGDVRIVALGDSTTAPRKGVKNVYADRLPSLLAKHGIKAQVINAGVGGSHTGRLEDNAKHKRAHALDRFDKEVRAHKPDVVIIQFGINDSWIDHGESEAPSRIDVTHYRRNLSHMVRTLKADSAKVILMTPNALGKRYEAFRHERLSEYADATRGIAKDQKTMLVDIWNQFRNHKPDAWLLDGMHPNDAGHEVIAQYLASAIAAAVQPSTKPIVFRPAPIGEVNIAEQKLIDKGKPIAVHAAAKWKHGDGYIELAGKQSINANFRILNNLDFTIKARLRMVNQAKSAASFALGNDHFGFEGARGTMYLNGKMFGGTRMLGKPDTVFESESWIDFSVTRRDGVIDYRINDKSVVTAKSDGSFNRIGFLPWRSTMQISEFSIAGGVAAVEPPPPPKPPAKPFTIPVIDLNDHKHRQVIVDREKGQYLGHPTTVLLEDNKTMLCVYPKGHGRGAIVYKRSNDGGLTWSDRLPTPASWATSKEVPTLHRVIDPNGKKRIIMWSGLYPARLAVTEDDGKTWSELNKVGDWGGIVVMGCLEPLKTGKGHYMALFHDDGRFFTSKPNRRGVMTLFKTFSKDGGLTWSFPEEIYKSSEVHLCEPGIIRSPDGKQLAVLLRENARRRNSHIIFSNDEGRTWTKPREMPSSLNGDRHTGKYAPDGRLFISFRDRLPRGVSSPTEGDWVGWVGTYEDLVKGREGQYRVRLKDNTKGADCAYPPVEVLPDGTFITTTYGHWDKGEAPYILSVRFKLEELDAIAKKMKEKKARAPAKKPNVVFVLVDDLGWSDLGYMGSKTYETPNVDALAKQGMAFTDFYSAGPVCSPTRASIITGKYPTRTGITTYLLHPDRDPPNVMSHLPLTEHTIAEAFRGHGYATGYFGKWHLGYKAEHWAGEQGFDVAKGGIDLPWAWTLCYPDRDAPTAKTWPKKHTRFFSPYHLTHLTNGPDGEYLTDRLTDETIRFIEQNKDKPFFAFLSFHTVHTPLQAKPDVVAKYQKKIASMKLDQKRESTKSEKKYQNNPDYAAMVQHMDDNVGRLLERIKALGLDENTIVVFTSDNGGKGSVTSNLPLRGMKHNLYEGGIRVPTIVRWLGQIKAGSRNGEPLISNDFYPTLLDLAGLPLQPDQHRDGVSFKPILTGASDRVERDALYWHYPHSRHEGAVRVGDYKLVHRYKSNTSELYNLAKDIGETNNLAESSPDRTKRMLAQLTSWRDEVTAPEARQIVHQQRKIPESVPLEGHAKGATKYGYRIPSLLVTKKGSILAFSERRVGLHDHAQNDIVLRRSTNGGKTWSDEIVAFEDGMNSINDPLTVQLENGRILLMFARFPYGRHTRNSGWIKMADLGYDDPKSHVLTFVCHSDDDGKTWSKPVDITRQVKAPTLLNANTPGVMIQLSRGPHKGRIVTGLWGAMPIYKDGAVQGREFRIVVAYSNDNGKSWKRTEPLKDISGKGFPNECQVAEASNGDIVLISRNQSGERFRKKTISRDGGITWSPIDIDKGLPSVACMGSVIKGPVKPDGSWDLWASFPSSAGRKDGQIAVSKDHGETWRIAKVIPGAFAYSALQISPDGSSLLCLYESAGYRTQTLLTIPFEELAAKKVSANDRPNVLFISVDDMNDWVGCLGHKQAITPNIDRLAKRGVLFTNAHCSAPVCNPSRVALLTGLNPDTTGVYENSHNMRRKAPDVVTLPQHFRANGYHVVGGGKVFHDVPPHCDDPKSWDEYFWWNEHGPKGGKAGGSWRSPYSIPPDPQPDGRPTKKITPITKRNFDWGSVDQAESDWPDHKVATWASGFLSKQHDKPFFLAVGIFRPHVPWFNPRKYADLYPIDKLKLPAVKSDDLDDLGKWARARALDGNSKHEKVVEFGEWKSAVQAYLASITHADANIGRVLDALDASPHKDNTIIVLWSDHGYHLGEKGHWHKRTLWERATRVPLVISAPASMKLGPAGTRCSKPVNLIDLYPTLNELCGVEARKELEGVSLVPQLTDVNASRDRPSVTTYKPGNYAVRSEHLRYISYSTGEEELYDHREDPSEWTNLASDPKYASAKSELAKFLPKGATGGLSASAQGAQKTLADKPPVAHDKGKSKPNILFIVSEDNSDHLGCYGEKRVHTPHLDALAASGVRYTRAYVPYSVCSPSRAAFLTGLYTRQNGHIGLATHRFSMYREFKTMPAYFQEAGYYTGFLGKTHVNPERVVEDYIDHRALRGSNFSKTTSIEKYAEEARVVMQGAAESNKPFMLIINYADAHRKFIGKSKNGFPTKLVKDEIEPYPWIGSDSPHLRQELKDYLNCINRLDEAVGMVVEDLEEMKVRDNTLIIYIADHGADFPRAKGSIYENGTRIPMIVNYPKTFSRGKVENGMVSTIDILPTMLKEAGLSVPDELPGVALQDIDSGKANPRQYIHTFTGGSSPNLLYMQFGIRDDRYKLVYNPDRALNLLGASRYRNSNLPEDQHVKNFLHPPEYELFDLHADPHEWKNLADSAKHNEVKQRLLNEMQAFQRRIKDPFADKNNIATFIAEQREYLNKPYRKKGFRWPHLDMFEKAQGPTSSSKKPNVLFIAIDDLRPELGCYGDAHIHSPNIDALAASGRWFERAYCQQAVCNPSRTSLMTGMRPDSIGVVGNHIHFRSNHPNVITLPQHFKNHGYHAASIGKIYHGVFPDGASITKWDTMGDPQSWSVPAIRFGPRYYYTEDGIAAAKQIYQKVYKPKNPGLPGADDWTKKLVFGPATESPDVSDNTLYDGKVADAAVKALQQLKGKDKPFFLAVGFIKPHSPYIAPKKYFDIYKDVALPSHTAFPADAPKFAGHGSGELRRYTDQPKRDAIPEANQRRVRHAYFACISYIDAQVGRVLKELERAGLNDNTIVVLYGDHGYHLGEQGLWGKTTNFELDTRVPLIVRAPGMKAGGKASSSLVELVDIYPTLAELAGLPITKRLEGKSFAPILDDPKHVTKTVALSQYPRGGGLMGYSMRTPTHRLTQWVHGKTGEVRATELYDYADGLVESKNLAGTSSKVVGKLAAQLATVAGFAVQGAEEPAVGGGGTASFEKAKAGSFDKLETAIGTWTPIDGKAIIDDKHAKTGRQCLQLTGGKKTSVTLDIADGVETTGAMTFWAERWTRRSPFSFRIEKKTGKGWKEIFNGDGVVRVGRAFLSHIKVPLGDAGIKQLRFTVTSPTNTGILIDDLRFAPSAPQKIIGVEVVPLTLPALVGTEASPLLKLKVETTGQLNPISVASLTATLDGTTDSSDLSSLSVYHSGSNSAFRGKQVARLDAKGLGTNPFVVPCPAVSCRLTEGVNYIWIAGQLDKGADVDRRVGASCRQITFSNGEEIKLDAPASIQRMGVAVRKGGDDGVHTYRIPGLATTNKGTLIGVYDVRRRGGGDLPGDVDVGMSRSTDGGRTWEPMKVIMDMGDDPKWHYDGIGDPAVLVDNSTGTIWVASTWSHGNRSWRGSGPGLKPEETGQFMLVRSDDDGVTWSKPINITKQIKKPEWCFILQGPGKGITMRDGTIVFPAQYQDPPDKRRLPHSTIIYSKDHGKTWQVGTGAFDDTTESQVVEIDPGVLMLNCRYNRKGARVVMTTRDMGKTWQKHPTSEQALIEPGSCMASLIDVDREVGKDVGEWLLFSNPDSTRGRHHITIKASRDRGMTWPKEYRLLLDEERSAGYSCMSMIDEKTVGILYEGSQAHMTFQRIPLSDLVSKRESSGAQKKPSEQGLRLPRVFGNHMVLQADAAIPVWGHSKAGAKVVVKFGDETQTVTAAARGTWQVRLRARSATAKPSTMSIESAGQRVAFTDVLIGEVWVCAGQSNMEWKVSQSANGKDELAAADHRNLRLLNLVGGARGSSGSYTAQHFARLTPQTYVEGEWKVASADSARTFSAVGWYFGRHLHEQLKVPIGLISPAVGGTPTEAWIPREALARDPDLKGLVAGNWLTNKRMGEFCRTRGKQNLMRAIQSGESIPGDDLGPNHSFKPGFMWSAGIEPLIPYAIRGAIWYQGESNAETPARVREHGRLLPLMIKEWRRQWGQGEFPFLYVQLPALTREHWPSFRDGQRRTLDQVDNVGMAITIDTGHPSNVHPNLKKPVGERLARWALGATYGLKNNAIHSGPLLDAAKREGGAMRVSFKHVGQGLRSSDGKPIRHFEICGHDDVFHQASAKIVGRNVISVSSPRVAQPRHVRYAWLPYPDPPVNLFNRAGLPASPFTTEPIALSSRDARRPAKSAIRTAPR